MPIDSELEELLADGKIIDPIKLPVEIGLVKKDGEKHLVAFVGSFPVFHSTYLSERKIYGALFSAL